MGRKILFLDVDGPVNVFGQRVAHGTWSATEMPFKIEEIFNERGERSLSIIVHTELETWLAKLQNELGVEIVWATTWVNYPAELACLEEILKLEPGRPCINFSSIGYDIIGSCGKLPGVDRWLSDNEVDPVDSKIVWADDMLGREDMRWALQTPKQVLALKILPGLGIYDPEYISQVEEWFS